MNIPSLALVLLVFALWVVLSYVAYRLALRVAPSFFGSHHPETAVTLCILFAAVLYAVFA